MSRNESAGAGTPTTPAADDGNADGAGPFAGSDEGPSDALAELAPLFDEGGLQAELAERFRADESAMAQLEAAGGSVDAVVESLARTLHDVTEDAPGSPMQAGRRLGKQFATADLDPSTVAAVSAELFDLAVDRLTETALDAETGEPADETGPTGDEYGEQFAALNRLLLSAQAAVDEVHAESRTSEEADRIESLEAERDELEEQLKRQRTVAKQVAAAVDATEAVNRDVKELAEEIDRRTENQAADVETVGEEASKLSATVEEVASMAERASTTSADAVELAEDGQRSGTDALERMEAVDEAARDVSEDVDELQGRIAEIDEFVEVINEVADQTNLLALNASIEAARAGEAGAGFSVVADEIKDLAGTSRQEAAKIETMVEEIQADAAETRESLSETVDRIREGTEGVETAIQRMEEIVDRIQETAQAIEEVSDASDDQAASAEEIAGMIDELDEKARSISDASSEITEGMEEQLENVELIASSVERIGQ